jgi:hypothetical protein
VRRRRRDGAYWTPRKLSEVKSLKFNMYHVVIWLRRREIQLGSTTQAFERLCRVAIVYCPSSLPHPSSSPSQMPTVSSPLSLRPTDRSSWLQVPPSTTVENLHQIRSLCQLADRLLAHLVPPPLSKSLAQILSKFILLLTTSGHGPNQRKLRCYNHDRFD